MPKILVIDDEEELREFVSMSLELNDYDTVQAENGIDALEKIDNDNFDCIVSDVEMPKMTGPEFLKAFREKNTIIPVIMLTGVKNLNTVIEVMKLGAQDYLVKPINVDELLISVEKSIEFKRLKEENIKLLKENKKYQKHLEEMVERRTFQLKDAIFGSLIIIASAIEARDPYTKGHSNRVRLISHDLGTCMDLREKDINTLDYGAMMHDVGKIGVSDNILHKNKSLTDDEFDQIMSHPTIGAKIVEGITFFEPMIDCIKYHHERFDGKGYPGELQGKNIPLFARIIAIADTYDAITTTRPYRKAMSSDDAIDIMVAGRGTQFDPEILDIFIKNKIYEKDYIFKDRDINENINPSRIVLDDEKIFELFNKPKSFTDSDIYG
ncbi:MAG: response regulator [Candidatus Delongbacteria bacterium]|nr:response regulator [Candidatus Delongbacteria bacterium]